MYELKMVMVLEKLPVFSLADVAKIVKSRAYSKKVLARIVENGAVKRIMKDKYTFHSDPFLVAPFLQYPSYISCASALSYHGLISQIPNAVFLMTKKRPKTIDFGGKIVYHSTKHFFGFDFINYNGFKLPVAEPEKAFIDSIGIHPLHVVLESLEELDKKKLLLYAKKAGENRRIGYLLEKQGYKKGFPKKISSKSIFLDPMMPRKGKRDEKWNLTVNF